MSHTVHTRVRVTEKEYRRKGEREREEEISRRQRENGPPMFVSALWCYPVVKILPDNRQRRPLENDREPRWDIALPLSPFRYRLFSPSLSSPPPPPSLFLSPRFSSRSALHCNASDTVSVYALPGANLHGN